MSFCVPKEIGEELKKAAARGEFDLKSFIQKPFEDRQPFFEKYAGAEVATNMNLALEHALAKNSAKALLKWTKDSFTPKEKALKGGAYERAVKDIQKMSKGGVKDIISQDEMIRRVVDKKFSVDMSDEQLDHISNLVEKNKQSLVNEKDQFGNPTKEYWKGIDDLHRYINSMNPRSKLSVLVTDIRRGNLLFGIASPTTNIVSNAVAGVLEAATSRFASHQALGGLKVDVKLDFIKGEIDKYAHTGFATHLMTSLDDLPTVLGENQRHAEGPGGIRAVGRFVNDVVIRQTQGTPDIAFGATAFIDRVSLEARAIAKSEGLKGEELSARANEIAMDATRIEPTTKQGLEIREKGQQSSMSATYKENTGATKAALGIRTAINNLMPEWALGDQLLPFVKTPVNVLIRSLDAAGAGFVRGLYSIVREDAFKEWKAGNKVPLQKAINLFIMTGTAMAAAYALASATDPDDYVGAYPSTSKEQQMMSAEGAKPNSVKIGGVWWSMDYLGPLAASYIGFMNAKKYGKDFTSSAGAYFAGVGQQLTTFPGLSFFKSTADDIQRLNPAKTDFEAVQNGVTTASLGWLQTIFKPAFIGPLAKSFDTVEREARTPLETVQQNIPGLRNLLPVKKDFLNVPIETQNALMSFFGGSRISAARKDPVIQEFARLEDEGMLPSITNLKNPTGALGEIKDSLSPEDWTKVQDLYRETYAARIRKTIASQNYKNAPLDMKKSRLEKANDYALDKVKKSQHYRPQKKVHTPDTTQTS